MNVRGAVVIDPASGDAVRQQGFTINLNEVQKVTTQRHRYDLHGDPVMGYFCKLDDKIELGPYPTAEEATQKARLYAGVWERAS